MEFACPGGACMAGGVHTCLPVDRMTDTCETLPCRKLCLRAVKIHLHINSFNYNLMGSLLSKFDRQMIDNLQITKGHHEPKYI